jgi:uncharacterized protein involved in exopolysaccharide biosynthesis
MSSGLHDPLAAPPARLPDRLDPFEFDTAPRVRSEGVSALGLLAHVLASWQAIALIALVSGVATAAYSLTRPREFTAEMTLATVNTSRGVAVGGALGSSLLGMQASGIEATPAFVIRLMGTEAVLREVAVARPAGATRSIIEMVSKPGAKVPRELWGREIEGHFEAVTDKEAGTIALRVTSRDSAAARALSRALLESTTRAFARASRAQATQLRLAQEARAEAAQRNLRSAEEQLVAFARSNREVSEYSETYVQQQRLERNVQLAQSVYMQVVNTRESAIAKELEDTPALVVLDPVPESMAPNSRHTAAKTLAAAFGGGLLTALLVVLRGLLTTDPAFAEERQRLRASVRRPRAAT